MGAVCDSTLEQGVYSSVYSLETKIGAWDRDDGEVRIRRLSG